MVQDHEDEVGHHEVVVGDHGAEVQDHEDEVGHHEVVVPDHEVVVLEHEIMVVHSRTSRPDLETYPPDHEVDRTDHEIVPGHHEVVVRDHEVVVLEHDLVVLAVDLVVPRLDLMVPAVGFVVSAVGFVVSAVGFVLADRQVSPRPDLVTRISEAEVDGERLDEADVLSFLRLLLVAGTSTSSHLISNAILTLLEHPEALARLRGDDGLLPSAIAHHRRTSCRMSSRAIPELAPPARRFSRRTPSGGRN